MSARILLVNGAMENERRRTGPDRWALAVGLALCILTLYAPVLSSDFVNWDDDVVLLQNPAITSSDGLARIWSTVELPASFPNYPLVFTSYWIEHHFWGLNPAVFHAGNAVLHTLNTVLVFLLGLAFGLSSWIAFAAALLFGAHPIQVESVAWISERKNVLSTFFALLTCLSYLRYRAGGGSRWYGVALAAFAAALLSKTATVIVPLSLAVADLVWLRRRATEIAWPLIPMLGFAVVAGVVTLAVENRPPSPPPVERFLLAATALWFYVGQLLAPVHLMPIYPRWEISSGTLLWWLPLAGLIAALAALRGKRPQLRWGLAHFAIALLPTLGLVAYGFNEVSYVADRHVYLASAGFFVALAAMLAPGIRRVRPTITVALVVVVALGLLVHTRRQIAIWRNAETLWSAAIAANPAAWVAYNNLAMTYIEQDRLGEAARLLEVALSLNPEFPHAENNLALLLYRRGDFVAAAEHCRRALALKPDDTIYQKNLGLALTAAGDLDGAADAFRQVVRDAPTATSHAFLANLLVSRDRLTDAIVHYEQALRLDPSIVDARNQLGRTLMAAERLPEAASAFAEVVRARPDWPEGRFNLSLVLQKLGQRDAAARELEQALALRPDFAEARAALAALRPAN
jgi:Tfp pilus assembly protein PilF